MVQVFQKGKREIAVFGTLAREGHREARMIVNVGAQGDGRREEASYRTDNRRGGSDGEERKLRNGSSEIFQKRILRMSDRRRLNQEEDRRNKEVFGILRGPAVVDRRNRRRGFPYPDEGNIFVHRKRVHQRLARRNVVRKQRSDGSHERDIRRFVKEERETPLPWKYLKVTVPRKDAVQFMKHF